jgi:hypothetical protein
MEKYVFATVFGWNWSNEGIIFFFTPPDGFFDKIVF